MPKKLSNSFTLQAKARNGKDGAGTERVYIRTKTYLAPVVDDSSDPIGSDSNDKTANSEGYLPMIAAGTGGEVEETDTWLYSTRGSVLGGSGEWGEATATPRGVSATWPYEWVKERKLGAPNARGVRTWPDYEGAMSLHEKWSKDGSDAESYEIVFTEAWAKVSVNDEISATLSGYAYRVVGGTRTAMAGATIRIGYILDDSDTYEEITANGSGYFSENNWFDGDDFGPEGEYNKGSKTVFAAIIVSGQVKCAEHVLLVKDAAQGQKGDTGKMCYIAGPYDPKQTYTSNAQETVAVEVENTSSGEVELWQLTALTNVVNGVHIAPTDASQSVWTKGLNSYNIIRAKYLFTDFASLGSFIVSRDFFLSQHGTLRGFGGDIQTAATRTVGKVYMKKVDGKAVPHFACGSSAAGDRPCYLFFDADDPMAEDVQNGPTFTIEGKGVGGAVTVRRVWFLAQAAATVSITVTPSSETNFDFGAVGRLDAADLSADGVTSTNVKNGTTPTLIKASGTAPVTQTVSVTAGLHFFEIAYLKDVSTDRNGDKAVFTFTETGGSSIAGFSMMRFRPAKVVNALSGEEWKAQGNVHVESDGGLSVRGTVMADNFFNSLAVTSGGMNMTHPATVVVGTDGREHVWLYFKHDVTVGSTVFSEGSYHTTEEVEQTDGFLDSGFDWQNARWSVDAGTDIEDVCSVCTGPASEVIVTYGVQPTGSNPYLVRLPRCQDYPGKAVIVRHTIDTTRGAVVRQADDATVFSSARATMSSNPAPSINYGSNYGNNSVTMNGGTTKTFYSTGQYWIQLD